MNLSGRLVLGTITVVACTLAILIWGSGGAFRIDVGTAILAVAVALVLALFAGRTITGPLLTITTAARAIASGSAPRFPRSRIPEVDALVAALREMHGQLGDRFDALAREKAGSAAIVEAMIEGIIATDARGRVVTANAAARRLLGYGENTPLPPLPILFRVKAARDAVDAVLAGDAVVDHEIEFDNQFISVNGRPMPGGGAVLVLHDLTAVRRLEAVRRDFVANVSHELKTPLTSISGYAETLVEGDVDAATRKRFLATILTNARRMQRLVDDLLDLSRIEAGRWAPNPEPLDTRARAADAWRDFADRATARNVTLELAIGGDARTMYADADAVGHILGNLFDNALRHVQDDGGIVVRAVREGNGVTLQVEDNGAGIPSEHLPRIFERFYRADPSRSRDQGGTGLGLAIVKHMVEAHGGRAWATSEMRRGTTVSCWFPDRDME